MIILQFFSLSTISPYFREGVHAPTKSLSALQNNVRSHGRRVRTCSAHQSGVFIERVAGTDTDSVGACTPALMEPKRSSLYSQNPNPCSYPEADDASSCLSPHFFTVHVNNTIPSTSSSSSDIFPSVYPTKILYACFFPYTLYMPRQPYPPKIFGEVHKSRRSPPPGAQQMITPKQLALRHGMWNCGQEITSTDRVLRTGQ